jgi:hypothetical protein
LGIPTVADRIAQEVVRRYLEPLLEPVFHQDSYGYRPGRSAIDAVRTARQRCWRRDWAVDIDIKGFFDSIDHALLLRAVRKYTDCPWVLLHIERWLRAPMMLEDGSLVARDRGTPQGGVVSPLLANPFLHYVFDVWLERAMPGVPFERYADDIVLPLPHRARGAALAQGPRAAFRGLRTGTPSGEDQAGLLQGYRPQGRARRRPFRLPRLHLPAAVGESGGAGRSGLSFLPAAGHAALKAIRREIRGWTLQTRSDKAVDDLARMFNPSIRGWIGYYGHFYKSVLYPTLRRIDAHLIRWVQRKFKRFRQQPRGARNWLAQVIRSLPDLFAHWPPLYGKGRTLGAV